MLLLLPLLVLLLLSPMQWCECGCRCLLLFVVVDAVVTSVGAVSTAVAVANDLAEVSIGSDDGLQAGHELEVFRADEYLGRLRVVSVKPDRAVVRVLKDFARGIVQRGDRVATRLKLDS